VANEAIRIDIENITKEINQEIRKVKTTNSIITLVTGTTTLTMLELFLIGIF
jgi:hypothetical protein